MLRIRKILLRGNSVQDAYVDFYKGANILAGESDTGKSYLVSCLDYILGAENSKSLKRPPITPIFMLNSKMMKGC